MSGAKQSSAAFVRAHTPITELARYSPASRNQVKWGFMRDRKTYAAAGHDVLGFWDEPYSSTKTEEKTNAATVRKGLADNEAMLVRGVQVLFIPGVVPGRIGASEAAKITNDMQAFYNRGLLRVKVNQDEVLADGPLRMFPPKQQLEGDFGYQDTFTADDNKAGMIELVRLVGEPYPLEPFTYYGNQHLHVQLEYPQGKLALPSGVDGEVEIRFFGERYLVR